MGDERGATTVEYALIAVLIVLFVMGGLELLGDAVSAVFDAQREEIES